MKTYSVLYAEDVPHYGFHDIEAENDQAAIEAAIALHKRGGVSLSEAHWDSSVCARIGRQLSALVAPSERSRLLQADAVHERISMPMHEPPFGPFTAKDLCDTQRPVLLW
jgi:hypothetical protein